MTFYMVKAVGVGNSKKQKDIGNTHGDKQVESVAELHPSVMKYIYYYNNRQKQ